MAKATTGAGVQKKAANGKKAADSALCLKLDNQNITQTERNIQGQNEIEVLLEILQQSLKNYQDAGGSVAIMDMRPKHQGVAIVLESVAISGMESVATGELPVVA